MTAKLDGTNGLLQQYDYQAPTTGFSYTFAAGTTVLVMNPAGTLATGTITMPAAPADGMTISFSSTQQITALTVNANTGQSIVGAPTTMLAGGAATFVYRLSNTTWYAQASTAAIGNTGAGAPVVTIYTSPSPWTKPATLKAIKVTVVAGGGAAGTRPGTPAPSTLGNGGGGGASIGWFSAPQIPGPVTVTVGAAGATSIPAPVGTPGGSSSFGSLVSTTGGTGGNLPTVFAAGGTFTPSPLVIGSPGNPANSVAGGGGNSGLGFGFAGELLNPAGPYPPQLNAKGYGAGGASAPTGNVSGQGAPGLVVVEEFY